MENLQHQQPPNLCPPAILPLTGNRWCLDAVAPEAGSNDRSGGGSSFGQDSGYTSYQASTPNNTFNLSSRQGTSATLATIDEATEADCSMNDSSSINGSMPPAINLTPKTAESIDLFSNIHLTTPKNNDRFRFGAARPITFDYVFSGTPERRPLGAHSLSLESHETPLHTGNRSSSHPPSQLTPHKAKGTHSMKRKNSSFREKLYSDDGDAIVGDENRSHDLNDSFDVDCRRLEDISPIPNAKRRKHQDRGIEDLMRSSTPKTVSSQPAVKRTLRKFQSFSPSKMQSNRGNPSLFTRFPYRKEDAHRNLATRGGLVRQNAFAGQEQTPEKKSIRASIDATPTKEHRVLAEIEPHSPTVDMPPMDLAGLLDAPILGEPIRHLEQTVAGVPCFDDFSLTPSKTNLIDPEFLSTEDGSSFAADEYVSRHAPNSSYYPRLNSILEESPIRGVSSSITAGKLLKTPPSVTKSGRKLKRLGTNVSTGSSVKSCLVSPAHSLRSSSRLSRASVSPKARRSHVQNGSLQASKQYSYCGYEYLNILHQLGKWNPDALSTLLGYIADTDLVQVVRVSRGWRDIIQNNKKCWDRLQEHLRRQEQQKENSHWRSLAGHELLLHSIKEDNETIPDEPVATTDAVPCDSFKRYPFKVCNSLNSSRTSVGNGSFAHGSIGNVSLPDQQHRRSGSVTTAVHHSPPVSPSKRKFVTNQKVAARLKPSEQLRPCPRCEQPSRIVYSRGSKNAPNKSRNSARLSAVGARLEKSYTLPDPDIGHTRHTEPNNHSMVNAYQRKSNRGNCLPCEGVHNNNDYSFDTQHTATDSPNRVRKNLFNSSTRNLAKDQTIMNQSNGRCTVQGRKLRSTTKSLDDPMQAVVGDDLLGVRDCKCDYAICSGQNCGFRFCIKCLCEYHPNTACSELAPNSPSKDEERSRANMACSRQSRRSLLRLCKKP